MHILIIPGWQETSDDWSAVATQVEQLGHTSTILDYPMPDTPDIEDQVELVMPYITNKTIVVGYSIGGLIAVQVLHRKLHHIVGGILVSSPSLKYAGFRGFLRKLFNFFSGPIRLLTPGFVKRLLIKAAQTILRISKEKLTYNFVIDAEQDTILPLIETPVKLVWGEKDKTVSPKIGEAMQEMLPNADFITIKGHRHDIHKKDPKLMAAIIDGFAADFS